MIRALTLSQYAVLLGVLGVTTLGGYAGYQRLIPQPAAAARIQTADVTRDTISATVNATGSVAIPTPTSLSFESGGKLVQLLVGIGDQVTEGQPLARIDDGDLQVALTQARAEYDTAVAKLAQIKVGSLPEDIRAAQAQLDTAKSKLQQVASVSQGPELTAAQSQVTTAQLKLDQLLNPRPEDLAAAQAQVDVAALKLQALTNPQPEDLAAAQSQLTIAKLKLDQLLNPRPEDVRNAEAALANAKAKLQDVLHPRPEDLAAAQNSLDQAMTKLAQIQDQPRTAKPEDVANAQLAVQGAQVAYDKALADAAAAGRPGASTSQTAADAAIKQALISLQTQQNNLGKLLNQGPTDYDLRLAQEAASSAQANLDKLKNPSPTDVQAAQLAVDQAQAALSKLQQPSPYDVQLQQEAINQAQLNLDKLTRPAPADVQAAQQALLSAQTSLATLQTPSPYDVQLQQEAVNQAQLNVEKLLNGNRYDVQTAQAALVQAQAGYDLKVAGPTQADLLSAIAAVSQAEAQLQQAQKKLDGATLVAPYAGTVSATTGNVGEQVAGGTAVITLADPKRMRVDVVVDETDVARVQPGLPVALTFDALPNQRLAGTVSVVAPTATVQQGVVNYQVRIQVDPAQAQALGVRPGMTASASITVAQRTGVVVVPNRAIRTQGRARTVEVMGEDGKTQTRQIQVGLSNDQLTEVVGGLEAGDLVVIPTTSTAGTNRVPGLGGFGGAAVAVRR